jgi:N-acetylglucosaminyl-diphospho-decaprenol L-rhamnosyltransferase
LTVAAAIVNYNAGPLLGSCVETLVAEGADPIVVVDNGSTDGSLAALDDSGRGEVTVIHSRSNVGYGAGVNRAVAAIGPNEAAILVCNPDVIVRPAALARLRAALDADPGLGIVGPRITNADGTLYPSARTFPTLGDAVGHAFLGVVAPGNRFSRRYKLLDWDHGAARDVDWVSGACFLIRRATWDALGGFDESYFMYMEDVDLCWRAGSAGWRVGYEPAAEVVHLQGVSTDQAAYRMIVAHHRSMFRYASRTSRGWSRLLLPLMAVGMVVRTGLACAHKWRDGHRTSTTDRKKDRSLR